MSKTLSYIIIAIAVIIGLFGDYIYEHIFNF